jgi:hypothetical protein
MSSFCDGKNGVLWTNFFFSLFLCGSVWTIYFRCATYLRLYCTRAFSHPAGIAARILVAGRDWVPFYTSDVPLPTTCFWTDLSEGFSRNRWYWSSVLYLLFLSLFHSSLPQFFLAMVFMPLSDLLPAQCLCYGYGYPYLGCSFTSTDWVCAVSTLLTRMCPFNYAFLSRVLRMPRHGSVDIVLNARIY